MALTDKLNPVLIQEGSYSGATHVVSVTYADLAAAAGTKNEQITVLKGAPKITVVSFKVTEAFAGGSVSAATIKLGTASAGTQRLAATDVTAIKTLEVDDSAAANLWVGLATTGGNTDTLTAGKLDIYVRYWGA